jgi:amino acid transporter
VSTSPFVIVAVDAGIPAFGDFVNVVILCSVVSIGLSGVYGGSRTLTALAEQGYAPRMFKYVDRAGRPLYSTLAILAFGPLSLVTLASSGVVVFEWLLALSGLAALFTWGSICLAHIRFRAAWKHHGHKVDELPFKAAFGAIGSWIGFILIVLVLIAQVRIEHRILDKYAAERDVLTLLRSLQFYVAVKPLKAEAFFKSYLAVFIVISFYVIGYIWKRRAWIRISDIDVDSGRREVDFQELERVLSERRSWPAWRRVLDKFV